MRQFLDPDKLYPLFYLSVLPALFICLAILISPRWLLSVAGSLLYLTQCFMFTCSVRSRAVSLTIRRHPFQLVAELHPPATSTFLCHFPELEVSNSCLSDSWMPALDCILMDHMDAACLHIDRDTRGGVRLWGSQPAPKVVPGIAGGCQGWKVIAPGHHPLSWLWPRRALTDHPTSW